MRIWMAVWLFLFVTLMVVLDVAHHFGDLLNGEKHAMIETFVAAIGILGLWVLLRFMLQQHRSLKGLNQELGSTHARLREMNDQNKKIIGDFSKIIRVQFATWGLTPSESEVALLLLKGLSLEEVASVRDTREKTVRQQASSIYKKAQVSGRHELAAYFFEDLLSAESIA